MLSPSFQPAVSAWLQGRFGESTPPQRERWPLVQRRENVLIAAPTGAGNTLAGFLTFGAMRLLRPIIIIVCIVASCIADAGVQLSPKAKAAAVELQRLQGTWEGVLVGDSAYQKITLTITGNSLHFHRDTNFWFETTFTLPAGKDPKQLRATIRGCPPSQADSIGQVVRAFFKIEDGTLTLATIGDDAEETPKSFEAAGTRYELRKVQPQKKKYSTQDQVNRKRSK